MNCKLTAEAEAEVMHAVGQAEQTREHAPLAPIHLETRSAEQLVELWHEAEEALSCRGQLRPNTPLKASARSNADNRIYWFVEHVFGAFIASSL